MTIIELISQQSSFSHFEVYMYGVICVMFGVLLGVWAGNKIRKIKEAKNK